MIHEIIEHLPPWVQAMVGLPTFVCTLFGAGMLTFAVVVYSDKIQDWLDKRAKIGQRKKMIDRMYPRK